MKMPWELVFSVLLVFQCCKACGLLYGLNMKAFVLDCTGISVTHVDKLKVLE